MNDGRKESPAETADKVARSYFGVTDEPSRAAAIGGFLLAAIVSGGLVPLLFYLRFGEVGPLGWGVAIFFVAYCLLAVVGLFFQKRTSFHTTVAMRGDWVDRIGAFWLMACAFGPFFGWCMTSALPLTPASWRWIYGTRVLLAIVLPIVTALPLTRYVRGKAALVAGPLLIFITLLPISSAVSVTQDLRDGPVVRQTRKAGAKPKVYLQHTERFIGN